MSILKEKQTSKSFKRAKGLFQIIILKNSEWVNFAININLKEKKRKKRNINHMSNVLSN